MNAVAYFPERDEEETRVASASDDGTIKITSTVSGEVLLSLQGHEGGVKSVAVFNDGTCLASGGEDNTLRVWDSKSGKELWASAASTGHSRELFCSMIDCFCHVRKRIHVCCSIVRQCVCVSKRAADGQNLAEPLQVWRSTPKTGLWPPVLRTEASSCGIWMMVT